MGELPERDAALLLDMLLAAREARDFVKGSIKPLSSRAGCTKMRPFDLWKFSARRRAGSGPPHRASIPKSPGAILRACATVSFTATEKYVSILSG